MAIKKSELYSSLWASCDELRGSMDASQYKDYVLVLLFMKYVSDKGGDLVDIPEGGSFKDMIKLKGQADIGDRINKIIGELARANDLTGVITVADFNDDEKLGKGKDKVDRLSNLITIFQKPELDFSGNRAENDDLLGDAYEYLMRNFATESGKSKGQFYTPSEVSRIMAKVIGINKSKSPSESLYDPTCGSGSLLLKSSDEAPFGITIYGQEMDNATRALAVMNMWLHGNPSSEIVQGNTLATPLFTNEVTGELKQFNFAVANPPFSYKSWMNGFDPGNDIYRRFEGYDAFPPKKNGDFAFLLHLIKSLKSTGKGCIVMPLGVLFRGNAEATLRKKIIQRGYIKGIIGLPPNLFYGTGIAACLIVIDKEDAKDRTHIFMIDASKGFMKDGNKNRLRSQDIHKIVDVFNHRLEIPKYSRAVPMEEIADPKNDYNLNIPRYIDSQEEEDVQDIAAHLMGGIPTRDVDALQKYWEVYPSLKAALYEVSDRSGYYQLKVPISQVKDAIFSHPEFIAFGKQMEKVFEQWKTETTTYLKSLDIGLQPKLEIHKISESLLKAYDGRPLTDKYSVYQIIMDYWAETMQDDCYIITADGWKATPYRILEKNKSGKEVDKGWVCDLIPKALIVNRYYPNEKTALENLQNQFEGIVAERTQLEEEHSGEDGAFADMEKINKAEVKAKQKELMDENKVYSLAAEPIPLYGEGSLSEEEVLEKWQELSEEEARLKKEIKEAEAILDRKAFEHYARLSEEATKTLVVDDKWMATLETSIRNEMDNISHRLTQRIKELAERYDAPLPEINREVDALTIKVDNHLRNMKFTW